MEERGDFYKKVVDELIPSKIDSVLVCGAGSLDKDVFENLGFENVTISNLDLRAKSEDFIPFKWSFQNAESLSFDDGSFDYVVIHAAIHHASVPHKVLTEMYRVAKKGVLAFESRDSLLMRFLEKFQLTQIYEHAAVYYNDCKYGGMNNTEIPNFVYRWTEREVEKTIQTYAPYYKHRIKYRYGSAFPCTPELEAKGKLKGNFLKFMQPFYWLFSKIFKKQQNLFAFFIEKSQALDVLFPWLTYNKKNGAIVFNVEWGGGEVQKESVG
jgi:SAM-dependent methyltransferase